MHRFQFTVFLQICVRVCMCAVIVPCPEEALFSKPVRKPDNSGM